MGLIDLLTKPNPEPGELLDLYYRLIADNRVEDLSATVDLNEQERIANSKLDFFLSNIADSPGARKVVEQFYEEHHGKNIDASKLSVLKNEVPDIDSILYNSALPIVTKSDLRDYFDVESGWDTETVTEMKDTGLYLVPNWIREHEKEPYFSMETGGTTGRPWRRIMTRNDRALYLIGYTTYFRNIINSNQKASFENTSVCIINHHQGANDMLSEVLTLLGADVKIADYSTFSTGGKMGIEKSNEIIQYLNSSQNSIIISSIELVVEGRLGVSIRRGELDLDVFVNGGAPYSDRNRNILESNGVFVGDFFGETEYPQAGAPEATIDGISGFDLPLATQLNLIYDDDSSQLAKEGTGRFAYLPYGSEGQVIPGVYLSETNATITNVNNTHQLLQNVGRVQDPQEGCFGV